jgi:hypothetical protein
VILVARSHFFSIPFRGTTGSFDCIQQAGFGETSAVLIRP